MIVFFGASTNSELFCLEVDSSVDLGFSGYAQRAPKTFFFLFLFFIVDKETLTSNHPPLEYPPHVQIATLSVRLMKIGSYVETNCSMHYYALRLGSASTQALPTATA